MKRFFKITGIVVAALFVIGIFGAIVNPEGDTTASSDEGSTASEAVGEESEPTVESEPVAESEPNTEPEPESDEQPVSESSLLGGSGSDHGDEADMQFDSAYTSGSAGVVAVEDARTFAHEACDTVESSTIADAYVEMQTMMVPYFGDQAAMDDYAVAGEVGMVTYCPDMVHKLSHSFLQRQSDEPIDYAPYHGAH